jgi:hypothetical protein
MRGGKSKLGQNRLTVSDPRRGHAMRDLKVRKGGEMLYIPSPPLQLSSYLHIHLSKYLPTS